MDDTPLSKKKKGWNSQLPSYAYLLQRELTNWKSCILWIPSCLITAEPLLLWQTQSLIHQFFFVVSWLFLSFHCDHSITTKKTLKWTIISWNDHYPSYWCNLPIYLIPIHLKQTELFVPREKSMQLNRHFRASRKR